MDCTVGAYFCWVLAFVRSSEFLCWWKFVAVWFRSSLCLIHSGAFVYRYDFSGCIFFFILLIKKLNCDKKF